MNLSDVTATTYLASDDYVAGTVWPAQQIDRVTVEEVPVPGSAKKNTKGVIYFRGAPRGWVANKKELRKIGAALNATKGIDKAWVGHWVQLKVVPNVRRPDGTKGNAFRVAAAYKDGDAASAEAAKANVREGTGTEHAA